MTDPVMLLSQLHGEGRVTFRALKAAGFDSLPAVAEAPLQILSDRAHLSSQTARRLKSGAEEMLRQGLGREAAPQPVPPRSARPAARSGRSGGNGTLPPFGAGVVLEEAALLGQGPSAASGAAEAAHAGPVPARAAPAVSSRAVEASSGEAAGAGAPPAPVRTHEAPAAPPRPSEPVAPPSFWRFG